MNGSLELLVFLLYLWLIIDLFKYCWGSFSTVAQQRKNRNRANTNSGVNQWKKMAVQKTYCIDEISRRPAIIVPETNIGHIYEEQIHLSSDYRKSVYRKRQIGIC